MPKLHDYEAPTCPECEKRKCTLNHWKKDGTPRFKKKCDRCLGKKSYSLSGAARKRKRLGITHDKRKEIMICEKCGFKAEHECQLDIDHIDGNRNNNDPSNHMILCANCHRLKTWINKDHKNSYTKS